MSGDELIVSKTSKMAEPDDGSVLGVFHPLSNKASSSGCEDSYDYFSPALMDCWPAIFSYVTRRRDLRVLTNVCRLFHYMLHVRKMSELVVPVLMKNPCFNKTGILSLRLLNKEIKQRVDKMLQQVQPSWLLRSFTLQQLSEIEEFIGFLNPTSNGKNAFISKQLTIKTNDLASFDLVMSLFQQHGNCIEEVRLGIFHSLRPMPISEALIRVLNTLPNVQYLCLSFLKLENVDVDDLGQAVDEWDIFHGLLHTSFPKLGALVDLSLVFENNVNSEFPLPLFHFVEPIIKAYGPQLEKFTCSESVFVLDIGLNLCNSYLSNLRKLELPSLDSDDSDMVFEVLSQVAWPNLESLALGKSRTVQFSAFFSAHALDNFKETLRELQLGTIREEGAYLSGINPVCINTFPQMQKLVVCSSDVYNGIWHVFRFHFINLEHLRFEPMKGELTPIPTPLELKDFFIMFPKLKKLTWIDGTGDSAYRIKFTRMDLLQ